jgi:hypothetical protein
MSIREKRLKKTIKNVHYTEKIIKFRLRIIIIR